VAALFAIHPLHVESVAWISERKDVLSTLFWMLTMWGYLSYVGRPNTYRYLWVVFCFILGLMAKPMLVTLPFALLLLDYWPLARYKNWKSRTQSPHTQYPLIYLIYEKTPLFLLAAASCIITFSVQKTAGAVGSLEILPLNTRIANALVSYVSYMVKMVWPCNLAVFYPHPEVFTIWQVAGTGLLLLSISLLSIRHAGKRPYFFVGWFWYVLTLIPVIGLVQVGRQAMADRYTYIPLIGLFIVIAWEGYNSVLSWCSKKLSGKNRPIVLANRILSLTAVSILIVLSVVTWFQIKYWGNSIKLYKHALDVAGDSYVIHSNLGMAFFHQEKYENAIDHFKKALRIHSNSQGVMNSLGLTLARLNRLDEAMDHFVHALHLDPEFFEPHNHLGNLFASQGKLDIAIDHYLEAIKLNSKDSDVHNNLGLALIRQGKIDKAIFHFQKALEMTPEFSSANRNLNKTLTIKKKIDQAVDNMYQALNSFMENPYLNTKLEDLYKKKKELDIAIGYYQKALSTQPGYSKNTLNMDNYDNVNTIKKEYFKTILKHSHIGSNDK
jgi:tetratricopeptide (TPR) repeat protein